MGWRGRIGFRYVQNNSWTASSPSTSSWLAKPTSDFVTPALPRAPLALGLPLLLMSTAANQLCPCCLSLSHLCWRGSHSWCAPSVAAVWNGRHTSNLSMIVTNWERASCKSEEITNCFVRRCTCWGERPRITCTWCCSWWQNTWSLASMTAQKAHYLYYSFICWHAGKSNPSHCRHVATSYKLWCSCWDEDLHAGRSFGNSTWRIIPPKQTAWPRLECFLISGLLNMKYFAFWYYLTFNHKIGWRGDLSSVLTCQLSEFQSSANHVKFAWPPICVCIVVEQLMGKRISQFLACKFYRCPLQTLRFWL